MRGKPYVVAGLVWLALFVLPGAFTASNAVDSAPRLENVGSAVDVNDMKPSACAALSLTALVTASGGSAVGGSAAELILGTGGAETLEGNGGDDCLVGGAGDDTLDGGPGYDVCIPGDGVNTVLNCEA